MTFRTYASIVVAAAGLSGAAPGCATKAMREQAAALADAGDRLESEAAAFAAARTAVVQLRQSGLVQRRQEVAEQGQYNVRTVAQWRVAGSEDRARRLAAFAPLFLCGGSRRSATFCDSRQGMAGSAPALWGFGDHFAGATGCLAAACGDKGLIADYQGKKVAAPQRNCA